MIQARVVVMLLMSLALPAVVVAQDWELGVTGGFASYTSDQYGPFQFGYAGAEICGWCSRRFSLFGEYNHWFRHLKPLPTRIHRVSTFDIVGVGLRIQGKTRIRMFADIGLGVGSVEDSGSDAGVRFGLGAAVPLGLRGYIRPQARVNVAPSQVATSLGVGVGYRF